MFLERLFILTNFLDDFDNEILFVPGFIKWLNLVAGDET